MPDEVKMWNGGTTNETKEKAIKEWNKMIRDSEDYIDTVDIEKEFNPRNNINKNMDKPAPVSGMGGKGGPIDVIRSQSKKGSK